MNQRTRPRKITLTLISLCSGLAASVACDGETSERSTSSQPRESTSGALVITSADDLPECGEGEEGSLYFVQDESALYVCQNGENVRFDTDGEDGAPGTNGDDGDAGRDADNPTVVPEDAGDTCPAGGIKIDLGGDEYFLCAGSNGDDCAITDNGDGTAEITCGAGGAGGFPGDDFEVNQGVNWLGSRDVRPGSALVGDAFYWAPLNKACIYDGDEWKLLAESAGASSLPCTAKWLAVDAGEAHACALSAEGEAFCWGNGTSGKLGTGSISNTEFPTRVDVSESAATRFKHISAGFSHSCALSVDGVAYCWGFGGSGKLGNRETSAGTISKPLAVVMTGLEGIKWRSISAGHSHTCAVTTTGRGYCWGNNGSGRLGHGGGGTVVTPTEINGSAFEITGWQQVEAGNTHTCGIAADGAAYCWGTGNSGRLGDGNTGNHGTPQPIDLVPAGIDTAGWADISSYGAHSCATTVEGNGYCWGSGGNGRLGNDDSVSQNSPDDIDVSAISSKKFIDITSWSNHSCGVTTTGRAYCWGFGGFGRLGNGSIDQFEQPKAVSVTDVTGGAFDSLTTGSDFTCGISNGGDAYCWGYGNMGRLGTGDFDNQSEPHPLADVGL